MPRLLLVARNPALAFGLASASDDIIEVRPSLVGRLEVTPGMADVVVIEQEKPEDAVATLDVIRAAGLMAPVLLVASSRPGWASFDAGSRPSVAVLDPPITQDRLRQSVDTASGLGPVPPSLVETELKSEPETTTEVVSAQPPERATELLGPLEELLPANELDDGSVLGEGIDAPIGAAVSLMREAEADELLPDGPVDLDSPDSPYATATVEKIKDAEAEAEVEVAVEEASVDADVAEALVAVEVEAPASQPPTVSAPAAANETSGGWFDSFPRTALNADADTQRESEATSDLEAWTPDAPQAPDATAAAVLSGLPAVESEPQLLTEVPPRQPWSDSGVYAAMASLVAASEERLAEDEPEAQSEIPDATAGASTEPSGSEPRPAAPRSRSRADVPPAKNTPRAVVDIRDQDPQVSLPHDAEATSGLVLALLARSHEVYGVSEAGALVIADALSRTGASAGALLLPDGEAWRVAAGEGLRRLEHRFVLTEDAWLVTTIANRHKGMIVDRTDVARRPLAGAPLAAHKHLVAAPVRAVSGILLIAKDDDPGFKEHDLLSLAQLAESSAAVLAAALDARKLARVLGEIRDQDDRAASARIDYGL